MRSFVVGARVVLSLTAAFFSPGQAAAQNPCSIITKSEAEAVVGARLEGPQLSPGGTLCKYFEPGYGDDASKHKLVTIGVFRSAGDPEAVNKRRQFILQDKSLLPVSNADVPNLGDAAIWVWAGGYFGALYAFKGGTVEVAVKVSGIREPAAFAAAKRFADRALGGTARTGYRYSGNAVALIAENYEAPGILGPLYLGTFDRIPDDEISRNYVISLVQHFNGTCERVPETFAVMDYAFYYVFKAQKGSLAAGSVNNFDKAFAEVIETMRRAHPHMLQMGHDDAAHFLAAHANGEKCLTAPVQQLYDNIGRLANERRRIPPDVPDFAHFLEMLSPSARNRNRNGFDGQPSSSEERQLKRIKNGCLAFTKGAAFSMEGFCRCHADAAWESKLSESDLNLLGGSFTQETMDALSQRVREYGRRKSACYT